MTRQLSLFFFVSFLFLQLVCGENQKSDLERTSHSTGSPPQSPNGSEASDSRATEEPEKRPDLHGSSHAFEEPSPTTPPPLSDHPPMVTKPDLPSTGTPLATISDVANAPSSKELPSSLSPPNALLGDDFDPNVPFDEWKDSLVHPEFAHIPVIPADFESVINYASIDCGAQVVEASKHVSSSSAILSQNRDSYMLTPCGTYTWFMVELCESILITSIQIANYELFSSMASEIHVSISEGYPAHKWTNLTVLHPKDIKGLQTFRISESVKFAKFAKFELFSPSTKEMYCPISVLKVRGVTMLDEFNLMKRMHDEHGDTASGDTLRSDFHNESLDSKSKPTFLGGFLDNFVIQAQRFFGVGPELEDDEVFSSRLSSDASHPSVAPTSSKTSTSGTDSPHVHSREILDGAHRELIDNASVSTNESEELSESKPQLVTLLDDDDEEVIEGPDSPHPPPPAVFLTKNSSFLKYSPPVCQQQELIDLFVIPASTAAYLEIASSSPTFSSAKASSPSSPKSKRGLSDRVPQSTADIIADAASGFHFDKVGSLSSSSPSISSSAPAEAIFVREEQSPLPSKSASSLPSNDPSTSVSHSSPSSSIGELYSSSFQLLSLNSHSISSSFSSSSLSSSLLESVYQSSAQQPYSGIHGDMNTQLPSDSASTDLMKSSVPKPSPSIAIPGNEPSFNLIPKNVSAMGDLESPSKSLDSDSSFLSLKVPSSNPNLESVDVSKTSSFMAPASSIHDPVPSHSPFPIMRSDQNITNSLVKAPSPAPAPVSSLPEPVELRPTSTLAPAPLSESTAQPEKIPQNISASLEVDMHLENATEANEVPSMSVPEEDSSHSSIPQALGNPSPSVETSVIGASSIVHATASPNSLTPQGSMAPPASIGAKIPSGAYMHSSGSVFGELRAYIAVLERNISHNTHYLKQLSAHVVKMNASMYSDSALLTPRIAMLAETVESFANVTLDALGALITMVEGLKEFSSNASVAIDTAFDPYWASEQKILVRLSACCIFLILVLQIMAYRNSVLNLKASIERAPGKQYRDALHRASGFGSFVAQTPRMLTPCLPETDPPITPSRRDSIKRKPTKRTRIGSLTSSPGSPNRKEMGQCLLPNIRDEDGVPENEDWYLPRKSSNAYFEAHSDDLFVGDEVSSDAEVDPILVSSSEFVPLLESVDNSLSNSLNESSKDVFRRRMTEPDLVSSNKDENTLVHAREVDDAIKKGYFEGRHNESVIFPSSLLQSVNFRRNTTVPAESEPIKKRKGKQRMNSSFL